MSDNYPNNDDGDALRRVASMGADMSRPMDIDFYVCVPDQHSGDSVACLASGRGYRTEVIYDDEDDAWDCYCTKTMLATYDRVVAAQRELDELSRPFRGRCDGWGTPGNAS